MKTITFGSLFAGIGGMDLGLERSGMKCVWQVENDPYAIRVLEKHWPNVARYRDVQYFLGSKRWRRVREAWSVDVICGGFPCQDISNAGDKFGIRGRRSGLWGEYFRIVRLLRPRFVVVENVSALLVRGMDRVLGDLASCGYDAEWDCFPAACIGAPHVRDRVFLLARDRWSQDTPNSHGQGERQPSWMLADIRRWIGDYRETIGRQQWGVEPGMVRVAHGVPRRVDRIRGLGNAVVPQIAELIGRRIVEWSNAATARFPDTIPTFPRKTPSAAQSSDIR